MIKSLPKLDVPRKIRIKFSKADELIYISHLDLVRTMTRAIIRARIPVKYTEGYNPIPKLVFATPLSVGCASVCEYLDLKIDRDMSTGEIKENLARSMPKGIDVLDVYEPERKFTDAVYSSYTILINDKEIDESSFKTVADEFSKSELVITKRSKSGEKEVDILPYIKSFECSSSDGELIINTLLCVSSADYLNPEYIVSVAYRVLGISKDNYSVDSGYTILRENLYLSDTMTEFK